MSSAGSFCLFVTGRALAGVGCVPRFVGDGSVGSSSLKDSCSELSFGSSGCHSGVSFWVGGVGLFWRFGLISTLGVGWVHGEVTRAVVASK